MVFQSFSFDKRVKENIKHYSLDNLYPVEVLSDALQSLAETLDVELLLTDREGQKFVSYGNFQNFKPDVTKNPGMKLRVCDRTVGHLYIQYQGEISPNRQIAVEKLMTDQLNLLAKLGEQTYLASESAFYIDDLESLAKPLEKRTVLNEKEDPLTGVFNKTYFDKRMEILDRAQVVPVAIANININDWKYANDHYGDEQSDRLIHMIAEIIREESTPEYVIGRVDGDVFIALIPMPEDGEAESFLERVQTRCSNVEDHCLAPSVAVGLVYKTNVEESIEDKLSDAEYEMLENKFNVKNAPGYRERLEKQI